VTDAFSPARRLAAEALGTALLIAAVVGSGIMVDRLAGGSVTLALLGNTIPSGVILVVLILALGPIAGAHFNPTVSLIMGIAGTLPWRELGAYASRRSSAAASACLQPTLFSTCRWSSSPRPLG
jgi:glycerol uptake facilitator-like aquaporin